MMPEMGETEITEKTENRKMTEQTNMAKNLTRAEFERLYQYWCQAQNKNATDQNMCSGKHDYETWAESETALQEKGYVAEGIITEAGIAALEPYRVKRAVILAAGFGSRLMPATEDCPKPMVKVKGVSMVETVLDAIVAAGISEIYLVRGHKGEKFDALLGKYPQIHFLENPLYDKANNISTAWIVRDLIRDAYVCEADLVVRNPGLIRPFEYETNYLGAWGEEVHDWCFWTDENGYVTKLSSTWGTKCYRMFGISFWTAADGEKLAQYLEETFQQQKQWQKYWDEISMMDHLEDFSIYVRPCSFEDILEIDTYEELQELEQNPEFQIFCRI